MRTSIELLAQPESMRSIIDATHREQRRVSSNFTLTMLFVPVVISQLQNWCTSAMACGIAGRKDLQLTQHAEIVVGAVLHVSQCSIISCVRGDLSHKIAA